MSLTCDVFMQLRIMRVQLFFFWGLLAFLISSYVARDRWHSWSIILLLILCFYSCQLVTTVLVLVTILFALYFGIILRKAPLHKVRTPLTLEGPSLDDITGSTKVMISMIALTTLFILGPAEDRPTMTPAVVIVWATTVALASWDFTFVIMTWVLIPLTGFGVSLWLRG